MRPHRIIVRGGASWGLLLLMLAPAAVAQRVAVQAFVDETTVGEGGLVTFTVEVMGDFDEVERLEAPNTRGLIPTQTAPLPTWSIIQINGRRRQRARFEWRFQPLRTGTAEVLPMTVTVDGRRHTTDRISVRVVPQAQRPPRGPHAAPPPPGSARPAEPEAAPPADVFVRPEPTRTTAFVGEQVVVDYVLHFSPDVRPHNTRIASPWDAAGFWREELELPVFGGSRAVTVDGEDYEAAAIKRVALFPARAGRLAVDSLAFELDVLRARRIGGRGGILYNPYAARYEREALTAAPVVVEVEPLPGGAPAAFRGAVGAFTMRVEADRTEAEVGEPIRVRVRLRGTGNVATLEGPRWEAPAAFEQYPPAEDETLERSGAALRGERSFTYTLVPRSGGTFELPAVTWAFFDPEAEAYRTLTSDPIPVEVVGPAAPLAEQAPAPAGPPVRAEAGRWRRVRPIAALYRRPAVVALFALPLLALLGLLAVRHARDRRDDDSALARSLRAFPEADAALADAAALYDAGHDRRYAAALDRTARLFLSRRLAVEAGAFDLGAVGALLAERGVAEGTRREIEGLLRSAETAQFAPATASPLPAPDAVARLLATVDAEADALTQEAA